MSSSFLIRRHSVSVRMAGAGAALLCISLFTAMGAKAQDTSQDVAEAARQERARKAAQAQTAARAETHVYTNEDLRRSRILVEEDSARVAARKQNAPLSAAAPGENKPATAGGTANASNTESLGAVARRYRQLKSEREAKQANTIPAGAPFHLEISHGALAEVAPGTVLHVAPRLTPHVAPQVAPPIASHMAPRPASPAALPLAGPSVAMGVAPSRAVALPPVTSNGARATRYFFRRDPFSRKTGWVARSSSGVADAGSENSGLTHVNSSAPTAQPGVAPKTVMSPFPPKRSVPETSAGVSGAVKSASKPADRARILSKVDSATPPTGTITVRAGDSLWALSRRYSGSGTRWPEWLRSNPGVAGAHSLRVGAVLFVPAREDGGPPGAAPALRPNAQTVVVRSGDSLWKISAQRYGDGGEWPCLVRANPGLRDANLIFPDQKLTLPAACGHEGSSLTAIAP